MTTRSPVIDCHVHWGEWTPAYQKFVIKKSISEALLQAHIDNCFVMGTDAPQPVPPSVKQQRFWFEWIDPKKPRDFDRFKIGPWDMWGFKLHPSITQCSVLDYRTVPYLYFCEEHKMPILVHCGATEKYSSYEFVIDAAEHNPDVNFIMAHMGGKYRHLQMACLNKLEEIGPVKNVYLDTSGCYLPWHINRAVKVQGATHVLFGSDFPWYDPALGIQAVKAAHLKSVETREVLGKAALKLIHRSSGVAE